MYESLISKIINFANQGTKISIFVHQNPDMDALGSAFALARILRLNTMITAIKIVGLNKLHESNFKNFFSFDKEEVNAEYVSGSIGFIVDTANNERVLSNLNHLCAKTMLIDHHVKTTNFTTEAIIDDSSIATCEMLGLGLMNQSEFRFDNKTLEYLLLGLTTDSNRLFYNKVQKRTYLLMAWFNENGIDHTKIYLQLYKRTLKDVLLDSFLTSQIQSKKDIGYLVVNHDWNKKFDYKAWSDKVYLLSNIAEFKIWFIIYFDELKNLFKVSLRSAHYNVRLVAEKYNGGGHDLASGCVLENLDQLPNLINDLQALVDQQVNK